MKNSEKGEKLVKQAKLWKNRKNTLNDEILKNCEKSIKMEGNGEKLRRKQRRNTKKQLKKKI